MKKTAYWEKNDLSLLFLLSIFMNGFETGGYQAALLYVGQEFDLSIGQQGLLAAVQLFATMIAPLLLGLTLLVLFAHSTTIPFHSMPIGMRSRQLRRNLDIV